MKTEKFFVTRTYDESSGCGIESDTGELAKIRFWFGTFVAIPTDRKGRRKSNGLLNESVEGG